MQIIFFEFSPQKKPPQRIYQFNKWFEQERNRNAAIQPIDVFEVTESGLAGGTTENLARATRFLEYIRIFEEAFSWFNARL